MASQYDDGVTRNGFAAGRRMTVQGQPFDPNNPDHLATLRFITDTPDDDSNNSSIGGTDWRGTDDPDVTVTASSPNSDMLTVHSQDGVQASLDLPNSGEALAGRSIYAAPAGDLDITRRNRN